MEHDSGSNTGGWKATAWSVQQRRQRLQLCMEKKTVPIERVWTVSYLPFDVEQNREDSNVYLLLGW